MTFGAPHLLWTLLLLPALAALRAWSNRKGRAQLHRVIAPRLQPLLAGSVSHARTRLRFALLLASIALATVALAKPRHGFTWQESHRKGRDILIAIDVSRSMLANDLPPSRLQRAKFAAQDLLDNLPGDRVGLIAFAGSAFLQAPLTIDDDAVRASLDELDTDIIPKGGTNIAGAIRQATEAFGKSESSSQALVIFSDGEELDADALAAANAAKNQLRIFTVGVGSEAGSLIPVPGENGGTTFVKDPGGNFVKSKLDEPRLRQIAEATGGFYLRLQNGPADMRDLIETGLAKLEEQDIHSRDARRPIERYQWPLAAAIALLAAATLVGDRKRAAKPAAIALLLLAPAGAHAAPTGADLYKQQKFDEALRTFEKDLERNPDLPEALFNLGTAAYQLGNYDRALELFGKTLASPKTPLHPQASHNLGNTLFKRGENQPDTPSKLREWKEALRHFDHALQLDPNLPNTKHNRDFVARRIKELEEQQKQDQQQQDGQDQQPQQSGQPPQSPEQPPPSQQNQTPQQQDSTPQPPPNKPGNETSSPQDDAPPQQPQQDQPASPQPDASGDPDKQPKPEPNPQNPPRNDQPPQEGPQQGQPNQPQNDAPRATSQPNTPPGPSRQNVTPDQPDTPEPPRDRPTPQGELRTANQPAEPAGEAPAAEEAEQDGKMSAAQAAALLRALEAEDARVQFDERKPSGTVLKDW